MKRGTQAVRRKTVRSLPTIVVTREPFYLQLGARIRQERERAGMSQAAVASALGLGRASVANIESAKQRVLAHQIPMLAEALGCDIARLFIPSVFRKRRTTVSGTKLGEGSRR